MAYLTLNELTGSGRGVGQIAEVIGGLIGPLAEAGATAYATYAQSNLANKELKAKRAEVAAALEQRKREEEARAKLEAERAKVEAVQGQIRSYLTAENVKLALAGAVLVGTAAVVFGALRRRKQNPRRRRGGR